MKKDKKNGHTCCAHHPLPARKGSKGVAMAEPLLSVVALKTPPSCVSSEGEVMVVMCQMRRGCPPRGSEMGGLSVKIKDIMRAYLVRPPSSHCCCEKEKKPTKRGYPFLVTKKKMGGHTYAC